MSIYDENQNPPDNTSDSIIQENTDTGNEKNLTDPKVCHDPIFKSQGIARLWTGEKKEEIGHGDQDNEYDTLLTDGIQYPLLVINNRNIEDNYIISYQLSYNDFLPTLMVIIRDDHQKEQRISSTQMSGLIRTVIVSPVDKVYKPVVMQFRINSVEIDHDNPIYVRYFATYEVPAFRNVNIGHVWMKDYCGAPECEHQGTINANTWEFLHELALKSGLGFAATKHTKEIADRAIRNVPSLKIHEYITNQINCSGVDEDSIMDAWVDLYGYIVLVNVSWVLKETKLTSKDFMIVANCGFNTATHKLPGQKPQEVVRTLTNYPNMPTVSNMMITKYSMNIDNFILDKGTLEKTYMIQLKGRQTIMATTDIQTKQTSIDGECLEDYNTGKSYPIPKFNFNCPEYTGLPGYDTNLQKKIRDAWFSKIRQSILKVQLSQVNLGLQRGTIVNIAIFDNDYVNKEIMRTHTTNLTGEVKIEQDKLDDESDTKTNPEYMIENDHVWFRNEKLSGMYYIDSMEFIFNHDYNEIVQILYLIKKGSTTGYHNAHTLPRINIDQQDTSIAE